jgi:L-iditol 2-dehydrogenase
MKHKKGISMKQAVMVSPGKIEFREIEKPVPGPGEILMATKRIGVCGPPSPPPST